MRKQRIEESKPELSKIEKFLSAGGKYLLNPTLKAKGLAALGSSSKSMEPFLKMITKRWKIHAPKII